MKVLYLFYMLINFLFGKFEEFLFPISQEPIVNDSCTLDLSSSERPQVIEAAVNGADNARLRNLYGVHVLHTDVVGLFGCPVDVTADEFDGASITFTYDQNNMDSVPPENLLFLWYDEENHDYREIETQLDEKSCKVSADITAGGAYMLVDRYEWFKAWGYDVDEYAHELYFTNNDFSRNYGQNLPEFGILLPKSVNLVYEANGNIEERGESTCINLTHSKTGTNPYFSASYIYGEDLWQKECDAWAKMIYAPEKYQKTTELDYTLANGAQAKLYRFDVDESSRGGAVGSSLILTVKISNREMLSFSYSVDNPSDEELIAQCLDSLRTFEWKSTLSQEAFAPAKQRTDFPDTSTESKIELVNYVYDYNAQKFSLLIPNSVTPYPYKNSSLLNWGEFSTRGLMICNGSDDIYYDIEYCCGENMWNRRLYSEEHIFNIEGESHTVTDISADTGFESEIYVLRFANTGKVESNHRRVYVFGFYKLSDTEFVKIRCDLWADNADELLPMVIKSLKSFRFG